MKGVLQWALQRITGLILFFGLIVHFYVMHYSGSSALEYEEIARRLSSPFWKGFDILFLGSILYHGFNGLWGIAIEYIHSRKLLKIAHTLIVLLAAGLLATGVMVIV